ncbi:GNAT family N-acetyltransferase [Bacillus badius]|uniref:GNAT family acetyltransferase n=1 Tax=Bacillus badius TaxID=1455 RepID=A0ABR5AS52_BACBA|nr:GNAT family protein [Bacillus badius]KIL77489.1 GNAT family acetyltransferase [Bacillus badius]MED4717182.1 GNAT family protein [Bacillus badius]UAT32765.1 GNAT family N-acetyltransferase [Bacillus badius]GLY11927.1 N-acetyltransferase [Bacillus badius]
MKKLEHTIVSLMPLEWEHIDGIHAAAQHANIWKHMSVDLTSKEACRQYVKDALKKREQGTDFAFVVFHHETKQIIGCTWFLDLQPAHKRVEIGSTWLNPDYWRTPVNTHCKWLLLQYCFEERGYHRVQIKTGHLNERSQRAIERIGGVKEGVLRNHMIQRNGSIRHTVVYSITREDWPKIKRLFLEQLL